MTVHRRRDVARVSSRAIIEKPCDSCGKRVALGRVGLDLRERPRPRRKENQRRSRQRATRERDVLRERHLIERRKRSAPYDDRARSRRLWLWLSGRGIGRDRRQRIHQRCIAHSGVASDDSACRMRSVRRARTAASAREQGERDEAETRDRTQWTASGCTSTDAGSSTRRAHRRQRKISLAYGVGPSSAPRSRPTISTRKPAPRSTDTHVSREKSPSTWRSCTARTPRSSRSKNA